jgi:hypothetical protein
MGMFLSYHEWLIELRLSRTHAQERYIGKLPFGYLMIGTLLLCQMTFEWRTDVAWVCF